MKFKKMVWEDLVSSLGKEKGSFRLRSRIGQLNLTYFIINGFNIDTEDPQNFYVEINNKLHPCNTVEECQILAQQDFESKVQNYFFE